jgi:group I intron endonuclease
MPIDINKCSFKVSNNTVNNRIEDDIILLIRSIDSKLIDRNKISSYFNISKEVISHIVNNRSYKNVSGKQVKYNISDFLKTTRSVKKATYENLIIFKPYKGLLANQDESGIYIIQNIKNGKCYAGSSYNIRKRLLWHKNMLNLKKHPNNYLQNAVNKYGIDSFQFIPLLNVKVENLIKEEQKVISGNDFNCCYNLAKECTPTGIGKKMTEEQKKLISIRNKGHKWTEEQRQRLSNIKKGMFENKDYKDKIISNLPKNTSSLKSPSSKLTHGDIIEIVSLINKGVSNKSISEAYPINDRSVSNIKTGKTYKEYYHLVKK